MKTQLIIIGLLATLAANGADYYLSNNIIVPWPPPNFTLPYGLQKIYPEDDFAMPPAPVLTTEWETNMTFNGREYGYRSDGVVVWRLKFDMNTLVATNKSCFSNMLDVGVLTNKYAYYTNIILGDILDNATKPGDLFRASRNGDPIYISLDGVTNLVKLCNKIGHVWKPGLPDGITAIKGQVWRHCILCYEKQMKMEEWK